MKRRFALYFLAANVIGAVFLWLAARELPFGQVRVYLRETSLSHRLIWSLVFMAIYAVCHLARVVRWSYLVRPLGDVDLGTVHRASAVGFAGILLLPLRLGEFVRPALLSRRSELNVSGLLATAVVERVIDGLLVTGVLFVTLLTYSGGQETGFARTIGWMSAAIFVPALTICLLALWRRSWALGLIETLGRPVSPRLADWAVELLDDFIDGFRVLSHGGYLGRFLLMTALYWGVNVLSMWVLARFGFGFDVSPWDITTVIAILVIGIMIPAGPALAGNFEYFMKEGLELFLSVEAVGGKMAVFGALVHILQFVVIVIPGIWVMWTDPTARHLLSLAWYGHEEVDSHDSEPDTDSISE